MYVKLSENTTPSHKETISNKMITCFGGIEIDDDEKSYLSLGPDFAQFEKLTKSQCEKEFLTGLTKIRWNRMGKSHEEIKLSRPLEEVLEEEEDEKEVFLAKRVFDTDSGKVDLGFTRSTNMKTSHRIIYPPGRPIKEEAVLEVRKEMWTTIANKYIEENYQPIENCKVSKL